ncbi:MAG: FAD-dependent oxidoreductase [Clostridia bacterium]|jgi:pyruvate/2-oxoglutarate dehydrogenase complex dihydrolipoamide dehydrogenase (E3) component|nr:FAD-dependent oxidoreductase [Clostridia bacterium]
MKKYDITVIGGGAAGITAALTSKGFKKKVLIIEKRKMGGECTHYGCVPSKALIKAAHDKLENPLEYVKGKIEEVYSEETDDVFRSKGIDVIIGEAEFINSKVIKVNGEEIESKKFIVATGGENRVPNIYGIEDIDYLTNENIFYLDKLPEKISMIGGGPITVELGQALKKLGVNITIYLRGSDLINKEEKIIRDRLKSILISEGIEIIENAKIDRIDDTYLYMGEDKKEYGSLFISIGREKNIKILDKLNIKKYNKGIILNNKLQTSLKNIYLAGDVAGPYGLSHMAEYQGIIAGFNASVPLINRKVDNNKRIWSIFTSPEISHLGLTEEEAKSKYSKVYTYEIEYSDIDRAKVETQQGIVKVILDKKYKILGAHIIGERAGELIHELAVIKELGVPITKLSDIIHVYPTYSDILKKLGRKVLIDKYRRLIK